MHFGGLLEETTVQQQWMMVPPSSSDMGGTGVATLHSSVPAVTGFKKMYVHQGMSFLVAVAVVVVVVAPVAQIGADLTCDPT